MHIYQSPCKINLFLYITGKRQDGYHNLLTLFYPISLYDTIFIENADKTTLECNIPYVPANNDNIILKTDNILREEFGLKDNFHITLKKFVPTGAGLGGGSANAATYIKAVNEISNLGLTYDDMADVMARLGSDTVFFLKNEPAVGIDRGTTLLPAPILPEMYFIIINPKIHISTKKVYTHKDLKYTENITIDSLPKSYDFESIKNALHNDMEAPVFQMYPQVKSLIDYLKENTKGYPLMSGSGSTVFCLFERKDDRDFYYNRLKNKFHSYFVEKAELAAFE